MSPLRLVILAAVFCVLVAGVWLLTRRGFVTHRGTRIDQLVLFLWYRFWQFVFAIGSVATSVAAIAYFSTDAYPWMQTGNWKPFTLGAMATQKGWQIATASGSFAEWLLAVPFFVYLLLAAGLSFILFEAIGRAAQHSKASWLR